SGQIVTRRTVARPAPDRTAGRATAHCPLPTAHYDGPPAHPTRHAGRADVSQAISLPAAVPFRSPRDRSPARDLAPPPVPPHPPLPLRRVGGEVPPHLAPRDRLSSVALHQTPDRAAPRAVSGGE